MTWIGVSGAPGRMGRLTIEALAAHDDLSIGGLFAPGHDGQTIGGHGVSSDAASLALCDIVIELTNPDVAPANVDRWREQGSHVVVGTSGYTVERIEDLRKSWMGTDRRCLVVPNFSIGAVLMMRFAELAAPHFASAEIIEMHHDDKPDAPSGTSLSTAARVAAARRDAGLAAHPRGSELSAGALGADVEAVAVHSLRVRGAVAHQEVVLGDQGQYLTIRHDTTDYQAFAPGVILALRAVSELTAPVTVGLDQIIGI